MLGKNCSRSRESLSFQREELFLTFLLCPYDFIIKNGKLAMEIPRGQKLIQEKGLGQESRFDPIHSWGQIKGLRIMIIKMMRLLHGQGIMKPKKKTDCAPSTSRLAKKTA